MRGSCIPISSHRGSLAVSALAFLCFVRAPGFLCDVPLAGQEFARHNGIVVFDVFRGKKESSLRNGLQC